MEQTEKRSVDQLSENGEKLIQKSEELLKWIHEKVEIHRAREKEIQEELDSIEADLDVIERQINSARGYRDMIKQEWRSIRKESLSTYRAARNTGMPAILGDAEEEGDELEVIRQETLGIRMEIQIGVEKDDG